jgi:hypothetical protein
LCTLKLWCRTPQCRLTKNVQLALRVQS